MEIRTETPLSSKKQLENKLKMGNKKLSNYTAKFINLSCLVNPTHMTFEQNPKKINLQITDCQRSNNHHEARDSGLGVLDNSRPKRWTICHSVKTNYLDVSQLRLG